MLNESPGEKELYVGRIKAVSPSFVEILRACKLRAGLSRTENARQYVLGNPKAWLGTAYHAVLEAAGAHEGSDVENLVREKWDSAIEREYEKCRAHPLDKRFGRPETWPGYYMVAAMALVRAKELLGTPDGQRNGRDRGQETQGATLREKKFSGAGGKIVGRPDVVRFEEVVDFKTGEVYEDEVRDQLKGSNVRQLRLYAFLVKETLGWWPRRGVLLPMARPPMEVDLKPEECEREAGEALQLLEEYNELVVQVSDPVDLASPSPAACCWCPYQLYCPAFWNSVTPDWAEKIGAGAVIGTACQVPQSIHDGSALSLSVQVQRGTLPAQESIALFPLDGAVHPAAAHVHGGDQIRVTGLWQRRDGSVAPARRTMIATQENLPVVLIRGGEGPAKS